MNIKCEIKFARQVFPKGKINNGDFGIFGCEVARVIEGEPKISKYGTITVKGNVPEINFGETYTFVGSEIKDENFGYQYEVLYVGQPVDLTDKKQQEIFLSHVLTEKQLTELFSAYENPIEIIAKEQVDKLTKVNGIGVKTANKIIEKYKEKIDYSDIYVQLDSYGLTASMVEKLIEKYKSPQIVINKIKINPYILITEVKGVGWDRADSMALNSGMSEHSPYRIEAFIIHKLNELAFEGYSYVSARDLTNELLNTLGEDLDLKVVKSVVEKMYEKKKLWHSEDNKRVGLYRYYRLEKEIAEELIRIRNGENNFNIGNWKSVINTLQLQQGWNYTEEQLEGIEAILKNQLTLITGGAGTGKSTIVGAMLKILKNYSFAQTALAGKASANLSEITGEEGYTIHRLLNYKNGEFLFNKDCPLATKIIILDEVSMVGGELFLRLLQAIPTGSKLIMLGDDGQLESIGVGNIMRDMMDSGIIKCIKLTKIHRQAEKSAIITQSIKVRQGKQIVNSGVEDHMILGELLDLELDVYENKKNTFNKTIEYFKKYKNKVKSINDIQIILPMKDRGDSCTFKVNKEIQNIYNPRRDNRNEVTIQLNKNTSYTLREGDKVINVKNNYKSTDENGEENPVFNGDVGIIEEIDLWDNLMTINFKRNGRVLIKKKQWNSIELAYAVTCHKLQGSSADIVICGLDYSHYKLLTREMVYTMITRAKKHCVLCAENKALRYAISESRVPIKQTFLKELLQELSLQ